MLWRRRSRGSSFLRCSGCNSSDLSLPSMSTSTSSLGRETLPCRKLPCRILPCRILPWGREKLPLGGGGGASLHASPRALHEIPTRANPKRQMQHPNHTFHGTSFHGTPLNGIPFHGMPSSSPTSPTSTFT